MKKRFTAFTAAAISVVMILCACGNGGTSKRLSAETKDDEKLNSTVVATIGESKISLADFNFIYKLVYDNMSQYSSYYGDDWESMELEEGKTMADYMQENAVEQVKQMAAALELAKDNGIVVDSDVKKAVTTSKNNLVNQNYGGVDGYKAYLSESRTTDAAFDRYIEICEIYDRLYKELTKVGGKAAPDEDKLQKEFIEENADKWRVQHILISTKEQTDSSGNVTTPAKSDEEAKKIADEVIKKLDEGADFDDLIEEYNEDPGISKGKFYLFGTGEMVPEFEEASKNLEVGAYTKEPVKTDYGYHVIKRYKIDETISEYKDYRKNKLQSSVMDLIEKKLDKIKPVKFETKTIEKYLKEWSEDRKKAAAKQNDAAQSSTEQPSTEQSSAEQSSTEQSSTEQSSTEQSSTEQSSTEKSE